MCAAAGEQGRPVVDPPRPATPTHLPPPSVQEGLRGLYIGILPEYYKVVPGVAIAFCTYELMKRSLGVTTNATGR